MRRQKYDFAVRRATAADAERIVRVQRQAVEKAWSPIFKENFEEFLRERFDHATQVEKYIERAADPQRLLLVVETENKIVGFGGARPHGAEEQPPGYEYQGNSFYLDPAYEGTGASLVLLSGILGLLKERGAKNIVGWCLADNRTARNFYERRGATLVIGAIAPPEYNVAPHVAYGWELQ